MPDINQNTSTRDIIIIELKLVSSTGKTADLMPLMRIPNIQWMNMPVKAVAFVKRFARRAP